MSIPKANGYFAVAAAALGVALTAGRPAVAETMLDHYTVGQMGIAQVNDAGQCVVIVTVNSGDAGAAETRVVGDSNGGAKLYSNFGATANIIKAAKITETTNFVIKRKLKEATLGDPISTLKSLHKAASKEVESSMTKQAEKQTEIGVVIVLGYDVMPADTVQKKSHLQLLSELDSVTEINVTATARKAALGQALTNAGINPATYLPLAT